MRRLISARSTTRLLARSFASSSARTNVSIVYGSFERGYSLASANEIKALAPSDASLHIHDVQSGNAFDFNSLRETDYLIVCTSSQNGYPPENLTEFAHQLYLAAMTGEAGCLKHLQHAVWGEGDPRWFETYMDVPRFVDRLLEDCGSRRFYARGEAYEPHAPSEMSQCEAKEWAPGMWEALVQQQEEEAGKAVSPPPVEWDALWAKEPTMNHSEMRGFSLDALLRRRGPELTNGPSVFARPDEAYWKLVEEAREVRDEVERRKAEAARRAAERREAAAKRRAAAALAAEE